MTSRSCCNGRKLVRAWRSCCADGVSTPSLPPSHLPRTRHSDCASSFFPSRYSPSASGFSPWPTAPSFFVSLFHCCDCVIVARIFFSVWFASPWTGRSPNCRNSLQRKESVSPFRGCCASPPALPLSLRLRPGEGPRPRWNIPD